MKIGLGIIIASMLLVAVEGFVSYQNGTFFPNQLIAKFGKPGVSFFAHGGMWGDMFLLPTLFACIIVLYGATWSAEQIGQMVLIGVAITAANQLLCNQSPVPDVLGWQGEKFSLTIAMHFVYMSTYVALAGLFFCYTPGVSVTAAVCVAVVLGIHMAFGTHVPLGMINRFAQWAWCQDFLSSPVLPYLSAVIWITLAALATIAAGLRAGFMSGPLVFGGAALVIVFMEFSPLPVSPSGVGFVGA